MKRLMVFVMAWIVLTSAVLHSAAQTNDDRGARELQNAIVTAKSRVTIPDEYSEFEFNRRHSNAQTVYTLTWKVPNTNNQRIDVRIVDDVILNYEKRSNVSRDDTPRFAKLTGDVLYQRAQEHLKKINPTVFDNIEMSRAPHSVSLRGRNVIYRLSRVENSIPVHGDTGYITVDKDTGELIDFELSWLKSVTLPSPEKIISQNQAKQSFSRHIGISPLYTVTRDYEAGEFNVALIYQPKVAIKPIDAFTGQISKLAANYSGDRWNDVWYEDDWADDDWEDDGLTEAERAKVDLEKELLSAQEALAVLVKEGNILFVKNNLRITNSNLFKTEFGKEERYLWSLSFVTNNADGRITYSGNATLNARTGELLNFRGSERIERGYDSFDQAAANRLARQAAEKYVGKSRFSEYRLSRANTSASPYTRDGKRGMRYYERSYTFNRYVNGIMVSGDTIELRINPEIKVTNFRYNYSDAKFPAIDKMLSVEQALQRLYQQVDMSLDYRINVNNVKNKATLEYRMRHFYLNAFTGRLSDFSGNPHNEPVEVSYEYTDLANNAARDKIVLMADNGLRLPAINNKLEPDLPVSLADFRSLARITGIHLDNSETADSITKSQAVKLLVNGLGYGKGAEMGNIFVKVFEDVPTQDRGYFAIAVNLGIVERTANKMAEPSKPLTRAQALEMFYKYVVG
ncbi:MAG: hypothetical protein FWH05_06265 [Oscillospiraceae bacterium]|nr:hypothetical protein [Oscillospiraceae bacterium]